jgi:hypothetical protein
VLYHEALDPAFSVLVYCSDMMSYFLHGPTLDHDSLTSSACCIVGTIDVRHHAQLIFDIGSPYFFLCVYAWDGLEL